MAINFNNVALLGISQKPVKLNSDLKFSNQKTITITGLLLDLSNDSGVEKIFKEVSGLIEVNVDSLGSISVPLGEIIINGVSYGVGYIEAFDVSGEQIQTAQYSATISITEAGSLSDIVLSQNQLTPTSTSTYVDLNFTDSGLKNEDLKYLSDFDENFSFNVSENQSLSINHEVSCAFEYRDSLITTRKDVWSGSTIQQSKLANLKNKGKKAIKVSAGTTASYSLTLNPKSNGAAQEYTLFFDYLGQNAANWGPAEISFSGPPPLSVQSIPLNSVAGRKKIKLNVSSTMLATIVLTANSTQDTFFDNFKLFKTDELPIEKSRALANFLLSNSPNYSIIQSEYEGKFKNLNLFENRTQEEAFDEIGLTYSVSRKIDHGPLDSSDDYSVVRASSLILTEEGFVQVNENSEIKILKNKSEANLRSVVSLIEGGAYSRSLSLVNNYNSKLESDCSTPTYTLTPELYIEKISSNKSYDLFSGIATLALSFTDDPSYVKDSSNNIYKHEGDEVLRHGEGFFDLTLVGNISGEGNSISEKNTNSKNGFDYQTSIINSRINKVKQDYSISEDFNVVEKNINTDLERGTIGYSISCSTKRSFQGYPSTGTPLIKSHDINVSTQEAVRIFNEFNIACKIQPQFLKNLKTAVAKNVSINVDGYRGVDTLTLLSLAKEILVNKGLMYGVGSDEQIPPTGLTEFLSEESFSHSNSKNSLSYKRSTIDLSSCPGETPTETDVDFGWLNWVATPTYKTETPVNNYAVTPTLEELPSTIHYTLVYTPEPYVYYPTDTTTYTTTETPTITNTFIPETQTETQTDLQTSYLQEVFIPKNYNGTVADLMPAGQIKFGKTCLDGDPASTASDFTLVAISPSWAAVKKPKDCEYSNTSFPGDEKFYSFIFEIPIAVPTPSDARENPYPYYSIDIPEFWVGSINDLIPDNYPNSYFIGGYRSTGVFQYGNSDAEIPTDKNAKIARLDENNSSHPNFIGAEVFLGSSLIFKSNAPLTPTVDYEILGVDIPISNTLDMDSLWQAQYTPTSTYDSIIGYRECGFPKSFNEKILATPTGTQTITGTKFNYDKSEVISNCNETLTLNRQLERFFIKKGI